MPWTLDVTAPRDAIRTLIGTTWSIPSSHFIPEVGVEEIPVTQKDLPMAIMELTDEVSLQNGGSNNNPSDITQVLSYRIWYLYMPTANENVLNTLETKTRQLALAFMADRKLGGLVSQVSLTGRDWSGKGATPPFARVAGSAASGYLGIQVLIVENKF